jgi:hypothetical protein
LSNATTVIPPSFDELVNQAQVIFQGEVTNVQCEWAGEGAQRHIVSYVTFHVADALKGSVGSSYTIRMLGGTVDGETMGVADAPTFKVGDKEVLFVENNGSQFVPLVGIMHGRFHLQAAANGREIVTNNEGHAVKSVARLGLGRGSATVGNEADLTTDDFKTAVRQQLQTNHAAQ